MSIHPNAPHRPSKSTIADPYDLLTFLLTSEPRLRRKDAEREVLKRFEWWNPWKPEWRPPEFPSSEKDSERAGDEARRASYQTRREEVLRQRQQRKRRQGEEQARKSQEHPSGSSGEKGVEPFFEDGDKGICEWTLKAAKSSYDEFLIEDHHSTDNMIQILFAALGRMRDERDAAISTIEILAAERARIKGHMAARNGPFGRWGLLYRKVGLAANCPDFVLKAARLAFRKEFHPDVHTADRRVDAERRFKETETVFEEIKRLRSR